MQRLKHKQHEKRRIEPCNAPTKDRRNCADGQHSHRADPSHDLARKGKKRDFGDNADAPQKSDGGVAVALLLPVERAERIINRVARLNDAGGRDAQHEDRLAQNGDKPFERIAGWRALAMARQFRREQICACQIGDNRGDETEHNDGRRIKAQQPACARTADNERDRTPKAHAAIVHALLARRSQRNRLDERRDRRPDRHQRQRDNENLPEAIRDQKQADRTERGP